MLKNTFTKLMPRTQMLSWVSSRKASIYEPEFLDKKLDVPEYKTLCIRLKGYDYSVLDAFVKLLKKKSKSLGFTPKSYPVPAKIAKVKIFRPNSTNLATEFEMHTYHRVIEINDIPVTLTPIFIEYAQLNTPSAITFSLEEPDKDEEEFRYVPDLTLMGLHKEVAEIEKAREERKKK